jgi:hypothetical protein
MEERIVNLVSLVISTLAVAISLTSGVTLAADPEPAKKTPQAKEQVYGSQLMTEQELSQHRTKMRTAKTAEEREKIRKEHHEQMKERAKERGLTLPDEPPARGGGMGQSAGGKRSRGGGMGFGGSRRR